MLLSELKQKSVSRMYEWFEEADSCQRDHLDRSDNNLLEAHDEPELGAQVMRTERVEATRNLPQTRCTECADQTWGAGWGEVG